MLLFYKLSAGEQSLSNGSNDVRRTLFVDLGGRRYAIPNDVLEQHEVGADLPQDERLTGLEECTNESDGSRDGHLGYCWRIMASEDGEALEYVVTADDDHDAQGGVSRAVPARHIVVIVGDNNVRIDFRPVDPNEA